MSPVQVELVYAIDRSRVVWNLHDRAHTEAWRSYSKEPVVPLAFTAGTVVYVNQARWQELGLPPINPYDRRLK